MSTNNLLILSQPLGVCPEQEIADKLKEQVHLGNTTGIDASQLISDIGLNNIIDIVASKKSVAFLLKDGGVVRASFKLRDASTNPSAQSTPLPAQSTAPTAHSHPHPAAAAAVTAAAARSSAKFRRVMLSATTLRRAERGLIIERGRPMVPASSVPEDLIAQAQVVLQGKTREVIVRELQRTNLNVNEAVNNLLSRDDDEDDDDSAGDVVLPEELLSLLDPNQHPALLDVSDMYGVGDNYEYMLNRERKRAEKEKEKKAKEGSAATDATAQKSAYVLEIDDESLEPWCESGSATPPSVERFLKIVGTGSELLAVTDCGTVYGWKWVDRHGSNEPHEIALRVAAGEFVTDIGASSLRAAVVTRSGKMATWLSHIVIGKRACEATEIKATPICMREGEDAVQILVSNHLAVVRTSRNAFHWCGLYPYSERPKLWEKERAKSRKHVTFDTGISDVKEGAEVRTKASPIYAAGSVAINLSMHEPVVGVLMESVWTLTEVCRFRIMEPSSYDEDFPSASATPVSPSKSLSSTATGESRKRKASEELFDSMHPPREEVWGVGEVVWIHEQHTQDTAVVKVVDGAFVGVEYIPAIGDSTFASSLTSILDSKDPNTPTAGRMRIMRKDDLCIMTPRLKSSRSPRVCQKEPLRFVLSGSSSRRVLSAVADSNGIRALVEKRGRLYVTRSSIRGKVLSEHLLPVHPTAVTGTTPECLQPKLINYGEDSILLMQDCKGSLMPLVRDAMMGFREPLVLHLPPIRTIGFSVNTIGPATGTSKIPPKKTTLVVLAGPSVAAAYADLPSVMQNVLFTDYSGLGKLLNRLADIGDPALIASELVEARSDGGANVLHAAVRMSIAQKNKEDADPGTTYGLRLKEEDVRMAKDGARDLDQKWQRMLRSQKGRERDDDDEVVVHLNDNVAENQQDADPKRELDLSNPKPTESAPTVSSPVSTAVEDMPMYSEQVIQSSPMYGKAVADVRERQNGAIETVRVILEHRCAQPHVVQMLSHRDGGGLTPFQAAINIRAYGAALYLWNVIKDVSECPTDLQSMIFPFGSRPDDSPLFLLCYNDTCSFTWTGEEHINQDIFECRTCGLTGSLCCCTECALTCHRNHDCKLKRTSPTAYCDCWEKCPCKALVAGNQEKREALLREILTHTTLYEHTNNRGDHVMLFLARTLGRQQVEQANNGRRRSRHGAPSGGEAANTPEHDLEPPKFAKFALDACLSEYHVIKSMIKIGMRPVECIPPSYEDILYLNSQNGSTHLDKFVFTIFSKCGEQSVGPLLDTLILSANVAPGEHRDRNVDEMIARMSRSIIRVYLLCVLLSPTAASAAVRGDEAPSSPQPLVSHTSAATPERRGYQAVNMAGFISILRNAESASPSKEPKYHAVSYIIPRIRAALLRLAPYAVQQAAFSADALIAPVRFGIVRPTGALTLSPSQDCLEVIEKFLNGEQDFTTQLARAEEGRDRPQRKQRKSIRRDTDRGAAEDEVDQNDREDTEEESDSDGDGDGDLHSSRRHNSQTGHEDAPSAEVAIDPIPRRKTGIRPRDARLEESDGESSTDSDSDDDDDEEEGHVLVDDEDNIDEEEIEDEERETYGDTSEGDVNDTFVVGDAEREGEVDVEPQDQDNDAEPDARDDASATSPPYEAEPIHDDHSNDNEDNHPNDGEPAAVDQEVADAEAPVGDVQMEEENTRDAVHSESSDVPESAENSQQQGSQGNDPLDAELSAVMGDLAGPSGSGHFRARDASRRGRRRNNHAAFGSGLTWSFRGSSGRRPQDWRSGRSSGNAFIDSGGRIDDRRDRDERERAADRVARATTAVTTTSYTRAPPSTQNNSAAGTSPTDRHSRRTSKSDEPSQSTIQASQQLATAFAFTVRLLCDLMQHLHKSESTGEVVLNWNNHTIKDVMSITFVRMASTWEWMSVVMDRMEAQLQFRIAINSSAVLNARPKTVKKKEVQSPSAPGSVPAPVVSKKEKANEETSSRRDAIEYILSALRSQSGEAGDDYPSIDTETIRVLVFVFDAHLCYHETVEKCKQEFLAAVPSNVSETPTKPIHRFFQRSTSVCYPGAAASDAWDTLCPNGSSMPLAEKSYLLDPKSDRESLFAPPPRPQSWSSLVKMNEELGIDHTMNMSLTRPCEPANLQLHPESDDEVEHDEPMEEKYEVPEGMEKITIESIRAQLRGSINTPINCAMARWKNVLNCMAKDYHKELLDAYGGDSGSSHILSTIALFPVRQGLIRKYMDKYRQAQSKDITLEVHRDPAQLIRDTVYQLNQAYVRRVNAPRSREEQNSKPSTTPMATTRVKVKFSEEPGEGSGVARSYYTALADALLSTKSLPFEQLGWDGGDDYLFGALNGAPVALPSNQSSASRDRTSITRIAMIRDRGTTSAILSRKRPVKRHPLAITSLPYTPSDIAEAERRLAANSYRTERPTEEPARSRPIIADTIYLKVMEVRSDCISRITGMIVDLPAGVAVQMIGSADVLKQYVDDAVNLMLQSGVSTDLAMLHKDDSRVPSPSAPQPHPSGDSAPLFTRSSRRGLYVPVPGRLSPIRISAYRNVGRIIGLCLSQGEMFPLKLGRHVLKYILDRPINWMDLQFFDDQLFESARLLLEAQNDDGYYAAMMLNFTVNVQSDDASETPSVVELMPGGENILVTKENVVEYVYRLVEMKMLGPRNLPCLAALRQGVYDVIPSESLSGLSAEDLRLLLCGADQICVETLESMTTFSDESHASADTIAKFKQWFWVVVNGLSPQEKQDLIFFWTGAPSLPTASESGQPQPTVMVRPPDDVFLPTANTCISRLYVPLYSSKKLLRSKLQMAIKSKIFGFV